MRRLSSLIVVVLCNSEPELTCSSRSSLLLCQCCVGLLVLHELQDGISSASKGRSRLKLRALRQHEVISLEVKPILRLLLAARVCLIR